VVKQVVAKPIVI